MIKKILFFVLSYILILIVHSIITHQLPTSEPFAWNTGKIQDINLGSNLINDQLNKPSENIQDNSVSCSNKQPVKQSIENSQLESSQLESIDNIIPDISFENMTKELTDYTNSISVNNTNEVDNDNDLDDFYKTMNITKPFSFDPVPTSISDTPLIVKENDTCINDNWKKEDDTNILDIAPYNDNCDFALI
jgi:hypothetical protein